MKAIKLFVPLGTFILVLGFWGMANLEHLHLLSIPFVVAMILTFPVIIKMDLEMRQDIALFEARYKAIQEEQKQEEAKQK